MPSLNKRSLGLYLRNHCERQFVLSLYRDTERRLHDLPPRQAARAGLGLIGRAGYEWQDEKVGELKEVFGATNVHENAQRTGTRPQPIDLLTVVPLLQPHQFVVEASYQADTEKFRAAMGVTRLTDYFGNEVQIGELHPDIIQCLPPRCTGAYAELPDERNPYALAVQPNGETVALDSADPRLRLRVIDIKLTSEPGAHYFAEVVYYSMSLAAWLQEQHLGDQFVVIAAPAVWPGSHEASILAKHSAEWRRSAHTPTPAEMSQALEEDIEIAPFDVFAHRLRQLVSEELPSLLSRPWQDLAWHVDYRCKGCEFLGYPWTDRNGSRTDVPAHCLPTAKALRHLSQVVGLSPGASEQLRAQNVADVDALAIKQPADRVFGVHQRLRAKRTTFPHRALALQTFTASVIPNSGGDALMPRWPDLHMYIFLDYDLSSALTAAISLRGAWREPLPFGSTHTPQKRSWIQSRSEADVFPVDQRSVVRERDEFLKFLRQMRKIFKDVSDQDRADEQAGRRDNKTRVSTCQIYLWDEAQRKHLVRLVGRHLPYILADPQLRDLAWLFPPPELLQQSEDATRQSPITLVANVIDNTVAVPIPHHYRLVDIASNYRPANTQFPSIHPLYEEPMSDLIPSERLHEWWNRVDNWTERQTRIIETNRRKAYGLSLIVQRLERELGPLLSRLAAPPVVRTPRALTNVAPQGLLWFEHARLNVALESLDVHTTRAMPPHEREARLKSARLLQRLNGNDEQEALATLNRLFGLSLFASSNLFVYSMAPDSREVNMRPGDFACALSPESRFGFLDEKAYPYMMGTNLAGWAGRKTIGEAGLTGVSIEAIDRVNGLVALRAGPFCSISQLEQAGLDFSRDVILDPVHQDFLTDKLALTMSGIGNPPIAQADLQTLVALGLPASQSPGSAPITPAAEILWGAPSVHGQLVPVDLVLPRDRLRQHFAQNSAQLDPSQWRAWEEALTRRLALIWGPPGTGKSRTLRAVVMGSVLAAGAEQQPLRLLITANTYTAIDNVLLGLDHEMAQLLPNKPYTLFRIQSEYHPISPDLGFKHPDVVNLVLDTNSPDPAVLAVRQRLENAEGIVIIGCLPQQLHNLAVAGIRRNRRGSRDTIRAWFDRIILDEASQMDVASSTLVYSKLAPTGACVLAGDDLQLPPIQQAEPPKDLEYVVGSTYNYFRHHHKIEPSSLDVNYRSNQTLVAFTRLAGYSSSLQSHSPDLRLNILTPFPTQQPPDWPSGLFWSLEWVKFLDPAYPAVSFIYRDAVSSQINDFEGDAVAALLWLLRGRLANRLLRERDGTGSIQPDSKTPYTAQEFWDKAVGVVTPHRAQMAKIIARLQECFPSDSSQAIRTAVDTVERFQGQQRDIIIASFGVGDPDIIQSEDEFLYNLNRFNVLTSRARAKLIVFVTRSLLEHLSDDINVLEESRLLKVFTQSFCGDPQPIEVGLMSNQTRETRVGVLRRR